MRFFRRSVEVRKSRRDDCCRFMARRIGQLTMVNVEEGTDGVRCLLWTEKLLYSSSIKFSRRISNCSRAFFHDLGPSFCGRARPLMLADVTINLQQTFSRGATNTCKIHIKFTSVSYVAPLLRQRRLGRPPSAGSLSIVMTRAVMYANVRYRFP